MRTRVAILLAGVLLAAACGGNGGSSSGLHAVDVVLGDVLTIDAEVAATAEDRGRGLMGRASLPEDAGMLFVFREPVRVGFYMKDTLIPLDIAFIGRGIVLEIRSMVPCKMDKGCPLTYPNATYEMALEVNAGRFRKAGVGPGTPVRIEGTLPKAE